MGIKRIVAGTVKFLKGKLDSLDSRLNQTSEVVIEQSLFDDLAPIDTADENKTYLTTLDWALQNGKVKNIALTGPYGSGKSSIIKTFERTYPQYKCLNISLATFKDLEVTDEGLTAIETGNASNEENHRLIELSILQQIFYREKEENIPNSRFKRISQLSRKQTITRCIIAIAWLWGVALLTQVDSFPKFTWWSNFYKTYNNSILVFAAVLIAPASFYLLELIVKKANKISLGKLNIKSGEIEFNPKSETSILNKHLDEILYFFEVTNYNVVVIEDLDRFNDPEIFTKLRELNYLLNYSLQVGRRIVFLYAVKDDMFKDETRTKFFDFIIPVIPVINSNNSYEKLSEKLVLIENEVKFDKTFINDVTLYISDMRTLKNIFNEYLIYKSLLSDLKFKHEKLLSLIIYKNIHPNDFSKLHRGGGILFNAFAAKSSIARDLVSDISAKKVSLEKRKNDAQNAKLKSIAELRALYIERILASVTNLYRIIVEGREITPDQAKGDIVFKALMDSSNIQYNTYNQYSGRYDTSTIGKSFQDIEKEVDKKQSYLEREQTISDSTKAGISALNVQIAKANQELNDIQSSALASLLKINSSTLDSFDKEFREDKLLVYLVREGWIDEDYTSLISYFYEGSLSIADMNFIMSVKNREPFAFEYKLQKVDGVMLRLKLQDFRNPAVFNYHLLDFLLQDSSNLLSDELVSVLTQISKMSDASITFFIGYLENGKSIEKFITQLCRLWPEIWDDLKTDGKFDDSQMVGLAKQLLKFTSTKVIQEINKSGKFKKFLEAEEDFLEWFPNELGSTIEKKVEVLDLKFEGLNFSGVGEGLFKYIYEHNHYQINEHMLMQLFKLLDNEQSISDLSMANYTTIRNSNHTYLKEMIENNIVQYVDEVLLALPDNTAESETNLILLLNRDELTDYADALIEKQSAQVSDIEAVPNGVWQSLLSHNKLTPTWDNVLNYFELSGEIDETLTEYLSIADNYEILSKSRFTATDRFDKEVHYKFSKRILSSNISDDSYLRIIYNHPYYYETLNGLDFSELSMVKMKGLIDYKKLRLSKATFELVETQFPELIPLMIEKNLTVFFDNRGDYDLNQSDYLKLLQSSALSEAHKYTLVMELTGDMVLSVPGLGDFLASQAPALKIKALKFDVLNAIAKSSISQEESARLFLNQIDGLTKSEITEILKSIGTPYSKITEPKKQPTLIATDLNVQLGQKLEEIGYIYKAKMDKEKLRFYNKG